MIQINDTQKIGVFLSAFGISFIFLGVLLLFDRGLLAIGNILFLSGVVLAAGMWRSCQFFCQREKAKGSIAFFAGILAVLAGWPLTGMCAELYGFVLLFRGFFPVVINFLRRTPFLGSILSLPLLRGIVDRLAGESRSNV